ncbi:MAG: DUF3048 domain-containing protein [Dehalococcoidia bacterium]
MKHIPSLLPWLAGNRRRQVTAAAVAAFVAVAVIGGVLAAAGVFSGGSSDQEDRAANTPTPLSSPTPVPTPVVLATEPTLIDGVLVSPDELAEIQERLPLAVMIDNLVTARPQVGLEKADLVFEAVAEGGITRFLAVYWRNKPGLILPVRSARVYYMDWAAGLDASYVHWGAARSSGPADVPTAFSRLGLRDIDAFALGTPYFTRDPSRRSPHNGIADTDALWELAAGRDWTGPPAIESWQFKEDEPQRPKLAGAAAAPTVDLGFGGPFKSSYAVNWEYDPDTNGYLRSQGGEPHEDRDSGNQIQARNVAVLVTSLRLAGDGTSHLLYETTGSGDAVVFQDGVAVPGTWSKPDAHSRIRFFDAAGNEIAFNRGQTWIEVLSPSDPLTF